MNKLLTPILNHLKSDRQLLVATLVLLILGGSYIVYVAFSLSPTELQVATRYTAFGSTQYYRDKWYYLISFGLLGLVMTGAHIGMMLKMHERNMRSLALAFGCLGVIVIGILFLVTHSVLGVAYLS